MNELIKLIKEARFIWICGNGGSASTAEHFSNDLFKKSYPAICLNSNVSIMTMVSNDYDYQYIFMKQLQAYAKPDDLLITISCSGTSKNIVNAIDYAKYIGMNIYSFETFSIDSRAKEPTFEDLTPDYGKLENKHLTFVHKIAKEL